MDVVRGFFKKMWFANICHAGMSVLVISCSNTSEDFLSQLDGNKFSKLFMITK